MPGISELDRNDTYPTDGELQVSQSGASADIPPKDSDPNPRPNEAPYYTNEGPVSPEQLRAVIAQTGLNVVAVRRAQVYPR